jgi:4-amino-4-deoxy-L-arabinose transferase-like glycosyltransferase
MSENQKTRATLALILLLCLVVRLGYVEWYLQEPRPVQGDGYPEVAESILTGKGFSVAPLRLTWFKAPGYSLFMAAAWSVVPTWARYVALLVAQVAVSVATCGLVSVIANAVFGRRAALAGGFLFALSPSNIVYCTLIVPETLQLFWIALATLLALQLYRSPRLPTAVGLGLVWGAAGLTRPEATLLLAPLLLPVLVVRQRRILARLSVCATAVLGKVAIMVPWVVRNYLVYGTFVLHVPVQGLAFAGAAPHHLFGPEIVVQTAGQEKRAEHPPVEGMPVPIIDPRILILRNERALLEVNKKLTSLGMTNLKKEKITLLRSMARHFHALWGHPSAWWDHWGVDLPRSLEIVWYGSYLAFLAVSGLGVVVAWKSGKLDVIPLSWLVLMAGHTGLFLFMYAAVRYQVTSAIFVYMFSGLGVAAILILLRFPALGAPTAAGSVVVVGERA